MTPLTFMYFTTSAVPRLQPWELDQRLVYLPFWCVRLELQGLTFMEQLLKRTKVMFP
jgi:hypothetical protein